MRAEGWERLLSEHIANAKPFEWGVNDCALWCASWGLSATGTDFAADWRGQYSTENELRALMDQRGFQNVASIADAFLPKISIGFASRGDIVLNSQGCLGICDGVSSFFLTASGVTHLPTIGCVAAWKVD